MATHKKFTGQLVDTQENEGPVSDRANEGLAASDSNPVPAAPELAERTEEKISQEDFDRVKADRDQLFDRVKADRDQLFDRVARLQAEFENVRKREARERADFRDFAVGNAVEQFLPVLDNFRLALKASASPEQLRTGVDLIVKQMDEVLRSLNVQPVETVGTTFDPRIHEALEKVERDDLPDNQVLDEVRRGYRIRERLLRPALVRVVSNPRQKEA
jgi:molecular chaperone GrpE